MSKEQNRIAVITGATSGIGFEVAKRLGHDGFTVILNGIENDAGAEKVELLKSEGIPAEYVGFDVTNEDSVNQNIKQIGDKYGKIDVVVNNAGGLGGRSRFEEMTTDFYHVNFTIRGNDELSAKIPYIMEFIHTVQNGDYKS